MKILHSRKGFTLIELLVVIGILAVLAAIAIPSVAGLIDRANKSADETNANEYTNAMERFVSEYELYKQDIASGAIKDTDGNGVPDDMDSAQGRVYNVTKAVTRADIELLESPVGLNGIRIDIDNKYAQNSKTAKAVMENYTKTSSSTFEPKQSDMTYWYHTETGYTVVADKNSTTEELQNLLPSQLMENAKNISHWIDLSTHIDVPDIRVIDAYYRDCNSTWEGIVFEHRIPNPRLVDVDFSKIYILKKYSDGELTMETADDAYSCQSAFSDDNLEYIESQNELTMKFYSEIYVRKSENLRNTRMQFRLAFQYEENGEVKYSYSPIIETTMNELIAQNKLFTP